MRFVHSLSPICLFVLLSIAAFTPLHAQPDSPLATADFELVEVARLGRGWVNSISWTAAGDAILTASRTGIWRYELDGDEALLFPTTADIVVSPSYIVDPNASDFAITALASGTPLDLQPVLEGKTLAAFSPDEKLLALIDSVGIQFWSLPNGELINTIELAAQPIERTLSFSPDNRMFAAVFRLERENVQPDEPRFYEDVYVWDVQTGSLITTLTTEGQDRIVTSTQFSSDGSALISARLGGVTLFDIASGAPLKRFDLPALPTEDEERDFRIADRAVFFDDETRIALSWIDTLPGKGMSASITVWDAESGEIVSQIDGFNGYFLGLTASPNGEQLAVYSYQGAILVWDGIGAAQVLTDQHPAGAEVIAVYGDTLATGAFDRGVRIWSLSRRQLMTSLFDHNSGVEAVAFSPDGLLAAASRFDTWTWDAVNGVQNIDLPPFDPLALSFEGDTVYGAAGADEIVLWSSAADGESEQHWLNVVGSLGAAAAGRAAIYADDGSIILYNLAGEEQTRFTPESDVISLRMSPDGSLLLVGTVEGAALWRIHGTPMLVWNAETGSAVETAAFSPDERFVALGTAGRFELRQRTDGRLITTTDTPHFTDDVAFSADSQFMIGALNTQIVIWAIR
jgi:WD40 repeat protein